jgi:hypothetical protein
MTIGTAARVLVSCNGASTVFPIAIQAYQATDITVVHTTAAGGESTLILNSDYSLAATGTLAPPAQTLTTLAGTPYPAGDTLQAFINPVQSQQTQYVQGQQFPSAAVQSNVDRLTQMVQRLQDQVSRALIAPDGDVSPLMTLVPATSRAGLTQMYDSFGNSTVGTPVTGTITGAIIANLLNAITTTAPTADKVRSAAELAAGVTPVNFAYAPGNVLRYGVNTTPGTTNMSGAIQAAANQSAFSGGSPAYLPSGQYNIGTTTITVPQYGELKGDGHNSQILYSGSGVAILASAGSISVWRRTSIHGLLISTSTGVDGIKINNIGNFETYQNEITGFANAGIHITGTSGNASINQWVWSNTCYGNAYGLVADGVNNINQVAIHHNQFEGNLLGGIYVTVAGKGWSIQGNDIEGNCGSGGAAQLYINGGNATGIDIGGNYLESTVNLPCIIFGDTQAAWGANIHGNYFQADVAVTNAIVLGNTAGGAFGVDVAGNAFSGTFTNAINANIAFGVKAGPNYTAAGIVHFVVDTINGSTGCVEFTTGNGMVTRSGADTGQVVGLTYGTTVATNAALGRLFSITVTNAVAFTISTPTNLAVGMYITYEITNSSGGAMGVITWTGFKLQGGAFTNPGANTITFVTFYYDGGSLRQIAPSCNVPV